MAISQDSSHPTGVSTDQVRKRGGANDRHLGGGEHPNKNLSRARNRKAHGAVALRLAGASWAEVASVLGYPTAHAALVACEGTLEKELTNTDDRKAMRGLVSA